MPCLWQLAHLHGLGDPFYVLLGFLHPVLQIMQYLPHLLNVLKHICNTSPSNLTPRNLARCTLFLGGLNASCGKPVPTKCCPTLQQKRKSLADFLESFTVYHYRSRSSSLPNV